MPRTEYRASLYSELSVYTESSVPTVWGPGTLAGRAVLALGEATLKGLNRIVDRETRAIQKRLATIRVSVPALTPEMYSELVELARPDLYPENILDAATDILFQQIDLGHTVPVVLTVSQLNFSEASLVTLRLFISRDCGLSDAQFPPGVKSPRKVLDLLAILLQVQPALALACFVVLDHLTRIPSMCLYFLRLRNHPVLCAHAEDRLHIPQLCRTPLSDLQRRFSGDPRHRWNTWRLLERAGHSAEGRVLQLDAVLLHAVLEQSYATPEFFDAAVDLFDVLRYSQVPRADLRRVATNRLLTYISMAPHSWEPLTVVLDFARSAGPTPALGESLGFAPADAKSKADPQLGAFLRYAEQ
ncbi:hypothetical protein DFH09DRAFT_1096890 [Mycena vulgaris]|nr:hypothetical protein DFH09DRAFT_1096890 [Mycena vulgaris]